MKPVDFEYERPASVSDAIKLLSDANGHAKVIAGGQSMGPMMNMRLVKPDIVVDIRRIPELTEVTDEGGHMVFGACVTHSAIEDGLYKDGSNNMMPSVAAGIAYRAVRNRGTIGGSLVHADPAADWVTVLTLLGAKLKISGPDGTRMLAVEEFMNSAFDTALAEDEMLTAIHVPKLGKSARWGYYKFCRKTGEFAEGMSGALLDRERDLCRVVIGATETRPLVISDASELLAQPGLAEEHVAKSNIAGETYLQKIHTVCMQRAINQVAEQ